jgi:hypothetical protein
LNKYLSCFFFFCQMLEENLQIIGKCCVRMLSVNVYCAAGRLTTMTSVRFGMFCRYKMKCDLNSFALLLVSIALVTILREGEKKLLRGEVDFAGNMMKLWVQQKPSKRSKQYFQHST